MLLQSLHLISADLAFPGWLRLTHFINLLFIGLLIRSGIQILGAHPRLYWRDDCHPGKAWIHSPAKKFPITSSIPRWTTRCRFRPGWASRGKITWGWEDTGISSWSSSGC